MRGVPLKDISKVTSLLTYYTILSARVDEPSLFVKRYYNTQFQECFANTDKR